MSLKEKQLTPRSNRGQTFPLVRHFVSLRTLHRVSRATKLSMHPGISTSIGGRLGGSGACIGAGRKLNYREISTTPSVWEIGGAIHSTKISGNFSPKLNGSVRSNRKSFEKTGPPFEVHFSRSDRSEIWLKRSRPWILLDNYRICTE